MAEEDKKRAGRNRTVTVSEIEKKSFDHLILSPSELSLEYRDDVIINGDLFDCIDLIPNGYFDLIIVDPPYNLEGFWWQ